MRKKRKPDLLELCGALLDQLEVHTKNEKGVLLPMPLEPIQQRAWANDLRGAIENEKSRRRYAADGADFARICSED